MEYTPQKAVADIDEVLNSTVYNDESELYRYCPYCDCKMDEKTE